MSEQQKRHFPPPPPLVSPTPGLWRRTPPAIFPPIMGLLGLGMAWRVFAAQPGLSRLSPVGEVILGATVLLFAFGLIAWLAKPLRRPAVIFDELSVLPGRAGMAAMVLSSLLSAAAIVPFSADVARGLVFTGIAALAVLGVTIVAILLRGPSEQRVVTPVFHLTYVGFILAPLSLLPLGFQAVAQVILYLTICTATLIWTISLYQLITRIPPAPLRPLLAIHLAPASLFATVSSLLGFDSMAMGFGLLALGILLVLVVSLRWLLAAGFSPLWGALTFPLAASATAFISALGTPGLWLGGAAIAVATVLNLWVAQKVIKAWAKGELAAKTNAAQV